MVLSVVLLVSLVSLSYAADKKQTAVTNSTESKSVLNAKTSSVAALSFAAVVEENNRLRLQAAEMVNRLDDLNSKLEYTQMMHTTISNLQDATFKTVVDDVNCQLDYVRMMNATLLNLQKVPTR